MMLRSILLACACLLPAAIPACADPISILTLDNGTVWQTEKPGMDSEGFIQIRNSGGSPDTLTGVNCTIADSTALVDASGAPLPSLDIAPGQTVTLSPKGPHIVLTGARYRIKKNGILPCSFNFTGSDELVGYLNGVARPRS